MMPFGITIRNHIKLKKNCILQDSYVVLNKLNIFPEDVREDLDLEISKEEIAQAIHWMKLGEKAGSDWNSCGIFE